VTDVVDTTGCGDSFAGGLGFGLLQDPSNYTHAARYANALEAQRTQGRTFEVFKSLDETNAMIRKTYGEV
jgi:adenosine kinase